MYMPEVMYMGAEFFLTMGFRKTRWPIRLISNANNNRVSSLTEAIKTRRPDRFQDIDSTRLALYKVTFISDSVVIHNLSNNSAFEVDGAIRMEPQDKIFTHFPIQPQRIFSGEMGISVIVYPPTETMLVVLSGDN